jgi:hypothetical protein
MTGTIVTHPSASGSAMRIARCFSRPPSPRFRHSIAVKKPLSRKNSGMRKP